MSSPQPIEFQSVPLYPPQHEAFAQLIATGIDADLAYKRVYPRVSKRSAGSCGPRLLRKVVARVRDLQALSATANVLSIREKRERLARMVRVDLENFDPQKDGDLLQEKTITTSGDTMTVKYKLPGKRECIMDDTKLSGELQEPSTSVQVNVAVPQVIVNAPQSFYEDRG